MSSNSMKQTVLTRKSSRICMKNIPPSFDESKIIQHLTKSWAKNGKNKRLIITDCRLLRNKQGKSRNVAFIGLQNYEITKIFISYFHNSYLLSSRVNVQYAFPKNHNRKGQSDGCYNTKGKNNNDNTTNKIINKEENLKKQGFLLAKGLIVQNFSDINVVGKTNMKQLTYMNASSEKEQNKTMEFLDSKKIEFGNSRNDQNKKVETDNTGGKENKQENIRKKRKTSTTAMDDIVESNRLFIRNIPYITTEIEIRELFSAFGSILLCHMPSNDDNDNYKKNKGYAYITFVSSNDAEKARDTLNMTDFQGRLLHIVNAIRLVHDTTPTTESPEQYQDDSRIHFKKKREVDRKNSSFYSNSGLSTTFVRTDAVMDNMSNSLGVKKGEILNVKDENMSGGEAAVRLALGETHVIELNRKFFRSHGVNIDKLTSDSNSIFTDKKNVTDSVIKSSSNMILIKNLPYDTCNEDIYKLLHQKRLPDDSPRRVLLAPSKTLCFVEYQNTRAAQKVFKNLAYKRFKNVPLYLEWVPSTAIINESENVIKLEDELNKCTHKTTVDTESMNIHEHEDSKSHFGLSQTIFVKNINFETTETKLRETFERLLGNNKIRSVRIPKRVPTRKFGNNNIKHAVLQQNFSMGYGFVECTSESDVINVVKSHSSLCLDGHILKLELSSSVRIGKDINESTTTLLENKKKTKLVIRNVPFQASRKDILKLFGSFGQLKNVRLPKKFDGNHRGFAFVDFMISEEAEVALQTVSGTHLYGRHLVLEWAFEEENI